MLVERAALEDHEAVCAVDRTSPVPDRTRELRRWIARGECLVARRDGAVVGFIVADRSFFEQRFIPLVVVHPAHRRRGIASALIRRVAEACPEQKLFTSTNRSNVAMQAVCASLGFVRSGIVENLDDGDPELIYLKPPR
jgi:ribosomal protein S18 acetylase RimI-like enzyme